MATGGHDGYEMAICVAPELASLVAVRMKIRRELAVEYLSMHNAVTVVLRTLVINNPEILGCPAWNADDFFIIMNQCRSKETGWRESVHNAGLEIQEDKKAVSVELFTNAVWYSIMCRMTPEWNRVGRLLIQGCDFLMNPNNRKHRALEVKVAYLPPGRLQLVLWAYTVTMSQMTYKDLRDEALIKNMMEGEQRNLAIRRERQPTCYVLPRESKGTVVSIRKAIPTGSMFENYAELRNYWKYMYGYCLPKDDPEFYCEVKFIGIFGSALTYPNWCLMSRNTEAAKASRTEQAQYVKAFVTDLYAKVPTLCGVTLKLVTSSWTARNVGNF